ncbi:MAG: serralysin [Thermoleophilaceae bacterium]|nr:serralysin [Thermoleophilaceae bacterium]
MEELARPRLAALPLVLALVLGALPVARAAAADPKVDSTVRADGTTIVRYVAPKGQDNELTLRVRAEGLDPYKRQFGILEDTGVDFYDVGADSLDSTGPLCHPQGTGVGCDVVGTRVEVHVQLANGDDYISPEYDSGRLTPLRVDGGSGNDALQVRGAIPTAVDFHGGPGVDAVDYFDPARHPFDFSDDGLANDGLGHDSIHSDVELYIGGDGNDRFAFVGTQRHIVFGTGGDDTMISGPGPEEFDGGYGGDASGHDAPSDDTVSYAGRTAGVTVTLDGFADDGARGEGDYILPTVEHVIGTDRPDTLVGPAHAPDRRAYRLEGGGGNDVLSGGGGTDLVDAGAGNDVIVVLGGGKDAVRCGLGTDLLVADKSDPSRDCEHVSHSYVRAASTQSGSAVEATVAVPAPGSKVTATLFSGKRTRAGSQTLKLGAGLRELRVGLNGDARRALRKARSLPLTLRVRISSRGRATVSSTKRVTLSGGA